MYFFHRSGHGAPSSLTPGFSLLHHPRDEIFLPTDSSDVTRRDGDVMYDRAEESSSQLRNFFLELCVPKQRKRERERDALPKEKRLRVSLAGAYVCVCDCACVEHNRVIGRHRGIGWWLIKRD